MSRSSPPDRVPTLTEVLERPVVAAVPGTAASLVESPHLPPPAALPPEAEALQRLMGDLQAHLDRVLDARVRAALEPLMQELIVRVTEETRRELASTLRDGITRALAQEMSRHRGGSGPR